MNVEVLLNGLSLLGDEPETIQKLRKLIIALAVAGRIGPSNCDGGKESFRNLIEEDRMDRRSVASSRIESQGENVGIEKSPNGIANYGTYVSLASIARIEKGKTGIKQAEPGSYPLVVTAEERASCNHFDFDGTAAIIPLVSSAGHGKASLQRLHYQEGKFALGTILAAVFPIDPSRMSARFIYEYLSAFKDELLVSKMIGTANVSLSVSKLSDVPVPFLSPSGQHQIDELMVWCDRLEAARTEREAKRDRLTAVGLARLSAPDPETFQDDARFALVALPALTTRQDQIRGLRQTILNLAVRGKLVPQDPKDEPATELLKQIAVEKARFGIEQVVTPLDAAEIPFELPIGWSWSRIGEVCSKTGSGSTPRGGKEVYKNSGIPFLRSQNIYDEGLRLNDVAYIDHETHLHMSRTKVLPGDLLLNITGGSIGRCCRIPDDFKEANVSQHVAIIRTAVSGIEDFLHRLMLSPYFQAFVIGEQTGAGRGGLPKNRMDKIVVALPPAAEQRRIVAKVDELMGISDRLEKSLASAADMRRHLLNALLGEALAPVVTSVTEVVP
jgi:type I restriction enzyme, S subunit